MKSTLFISALLATTLSFASCNSSNAKPIKNIGTEKPKTSENTKIQVALLLDTSNSMDGLIDQAKSRDRKSVV